MLKASILTLAITTSTAQAASRCGDFVEVPYNGDILCVSPDYYKVDGVRIPMGLVDAQHIADINNAFLPTKEMVDAIWRAADVTLEPIPLPPGPEMTSTKYYVTHNRLIEEQLDGQPFQLIAGIKKDIIQPQRQGRVTIYGWHRNNGQPIQPVSSVHVDTYYDYSHGVRLVRWPEPLP